MTTNDEPTEAQEPQNRPRTRRQLLGLAGAAAVGGAGLVIAGAGPASAADEGPLLMGNANNSSGGDLTGLNATTLASLSVGITGLTEDTTALSAASGTGMDIKMVGSGRLGMGGSLSGNAQPSFLPNLQDLVKSNSGALWSGTGALFSDSRTWKRINAVRVDNPNGNGSAFTPFRFFDSRSGAPKAVGSTTTLDVRGHANIPDDAIAIFGNLTVTSPSYGGWVNIWPAGVTEPVTSSINFLSGQTVANFFFVGLGTAGANLGKVNVGPRKSGGGGGSTHIIIDITAYVQ